jgi:hypothetical protein
VWLPLGVIKLDNNGFPKWLSLNSLRCTQNLLSFEVRKQIDGGDGIALGIAPGFGAGPRVSHDQSATVHPSPNPFLDSLQRTFPSLTQLPAKQSE